MLDYLLDRQKNKKKIWKKSVMIWKNSTRLFRRQHNANDLFITNCKVKQCRNLIVVTWICFNFRTNKYTNFIGKLCTFYQIVKALWKVIWLLFEICLTKYWLAELDSVANGIKNQWWTFCNCQLFIMMPFFPERLTLSDSLGMFAMFRKRSLDLYQWVS